MHAQCKLNPTISNLFHQNNNNEVLKFKLLANTVFSETNNTVEEDVPLKH